jgi:hypothetical protein
MRCARAAGWAKCIKRSNCQACKPICLHIDHCGCDMLVCYVLV